jgi:CHAT domain-containing protein
MGLPLVEEEINRLGAVCLASNQPLTFQELLNSDASVVNVLQSMHSSNWLHLACHGQQDPTDPLKSSLLLHDGALELRQILETTIPATGSRFVFLSACQTAMGDEKLANEAMHLAGGFIAAGYQGAIGTLWNMADSDGPTVAEAVYEQIFSRRDNEGPDVTLAAAGLHLAVQGLRKAGAPFQQWMPYIHFGI